MEPTSEEASVPETDAPQQRPQDPPRALLPEFLHQGGAAQKVSNPKQRRQLVASGGTS